MKIWEFNAWAKKKKKIQEFLGSLVTTYSNNIPQAIKQSG